MTKEWENWIVPGARVRCIRQVWDNRVRAVHIPAFNEVLTIERVLEHPHHKGWFGITFVEFPAEWPDPTDYAAGKTVHAVYTDDKPLIPNFEPVE